MRISPREERPKIHCIKAHLELEQRVEERTRELQKAKENLEKNFWNIK